MTRTHTSMGLKKESFNPTRMRRQTVIDQSAARCTIRVGTQILMNQILDKTIWELSRVIDGGNMNVKIKASQEARTEMVFIIMASPTYFSLSPFTKVLAQFLQHGIDAAKQKKLTKYSYLPSLLKVCHL
jgi:hypothetical protein